MFNQSSFVLRKVDSIGFKEFYYFEFSKDSVLYKVIHRKNDNQFIKSFRRLRVNRYYKTKLVPLRFVPYEDSNYYDLTNFRIYNLKEDNFVGGRNRVYGFLSLPKLVGEGHVSD
jgi:hypothetical protein